MRAGVQVPPLRVADVAGQAHVARQGWLRRARLPAGGGRRQASGQDQRRCSWRALAQPFVGVEQHADVLARVERPDEQDVCRRLRGPGLPDRLGPGGRAWLAQVYARRRYPERMFDVGRGVGRGHDDGRRRRGMAADEARKVAPHLGRHSLRVPQEVQVVDRQDRGGPTGRDGHGCGRVDHVGGSGQPFDRWPAQAIPAPGERPCGDPAIDNAHAGQLIDHGRRGPVLPRRREERHLVRRGGAARPRQCADELVHVLPDTGPLPEGRSVIHEDPHAEGGYHRSDKSLRVSMLTVFKGRW